jgi:hypothetical protein
MSQNPNGRVWSMKKKFKTQSSAAKVMLTVFWDSKGPILEDYPEKGCTINSASKWLRDQPKTFVEGIRKLVDRWTKCIEKEGDNVEK